MNADLIVDTPVSGEPPASPMVRARHLTDLDLRRRTTVEEVAWLHAHPLWWLRSLQRILIEVDEHIDKAERGARLARLRDGDTARTRAHEATVLQQNIGRVHFRGEVTSRLLDVAALCGPDVDSPLIGEAVAAFTLIVERLGRGQVDLAREVACQWARRLTGRHARVDIPDNTAAAPIRVAVAGLKPATVLNCRACLAKRGVDPRAARPRCTRCGQEHLIEQENRS